MTTKVSQTWMFSRGTGRAAPQGGAECAVGLHDVITPSRLEASSPAKVAVDMIWTCSWTPLCPTARAMLSHSGQFVHLAGFGAVHGRRSRGHRRREMARGNRSLFRDPHARLVAGRQGHLGDSISQTLSKQYGLLLGSRDLQVRSVGAALVGRSRQLIRASEQVGGEPGSAEA